MDTYIENAHELTHDDAKEIKQWVKKARSLWEDFEPLRKKIVAHDEMLTDEEREGLQSKASYEALKELVQILLNISHALEQAEINGRKPDLRNDNNGIRKTR